MLFRIAHPSDEDDEPIIDDDDTIDDDDVYAVIKSILKAPEDT